MLILGRQEDVDAGRVLRAALRHDTVPVAERREGAQAHQLRQVRVLLGDLPDGQGDILHARVVRIDVRQQVADLGPGTVGADDQIEGLLAVESKVELDFSVHRRRWPGPRRQLVLPHRLKASPSLPLFILYTL